MTYSYILSTIVGQIRLIIGDKDITDAVFTNEELTAFYTMEGSINLAAAAALEAWAATYSANADNERIGDYSYSQNIVTKMLTLAAKLKEKDAGILAMDIASMDLTAGSGITAEED
uniref:Uncharacterized protein n=1 Tax=viral metagenome TaxID=1070528 RepID=A0A6M3KLB6_9ZZZZ